METGGWMDRMRSAVAHRGEAIVARLSQRALDALEAFERVEDRLARAPALLKGLRTRASDTLRQNARQGMSEERAAPGTADGSSAHGAPEVSGADGAREAAPVGTDGERPARRKAGPTSPAAKRPGRAGVKVKRGQKHHHHH